MKLLYNFEKFKHKIEAGKCKKISVDRINALKCSIKDEQDNQHNELYY